MRDAEVRLLYWAGPGDVKANFLHWSAGRQDDSITGVGYSQLVFEACAELDIPLLALTSHPNDCVAGNDLIRVESVPAFFASASGLAYRAAHLRAALHIAQRARDFGANVVAISEEIAPTAVLPLRALGIRLLQIRHCSLWPRLTQPRLLDQLAWRLHGYAYRIGFSAVLGVSATIASQVKETIGDSSVPTVEFIPFWREMFFDVPPPPKSRSPFRVLFSGRTTACKGIFDLLTLAKQLAERGHAFEFEVCGDGPDLPEARRRIAEEGLTNVFVRGWCSPQKLRDHLAGCHAVVVPTTACFNEGFNKVVVEALLARRPVVVSDVCPSVEYVKDALLVYPTGDLDACRESLIRLATDSALYTEKQAQTARAVRPFLDSRFSLREAMRNVLLPLQKGGRIEPRTVLSSSEFAAAQSDRDDLLIPTPTAA